MKTLVPSHPKTRMLAGLLEIRTPEAVGILALLWNYAKQTAQDGDLSALNPRRLAAMLEWPIAEGDRLYAALLEAGWVDRHPHKEGAFVVHDWLQHCENYILRDLAKAGRIPSDKSRSVDLHEFYAPRPVVTCHDKSGHETACNHYPPPSPPPSRSLPTAKRKTNTPADAGSGSFDAWWASYPVRGPGIPRGNRKKAWAEWVKLGDDARAEVVEATRRLVKSGTYPKDAERFLKGSKGADPPYKAFLDDTPVSVVSVASKPTAAQVKESRNYEYDSSWLDEFGSKGDKA
jgi:hypothetical protein